MNTDNMSILGLTIDYGPYGWLENYDPHWTPNTTDAEGRRYRFGQQPQIAMWNLVQLANALYPLINEVKPLEDALDRYRSSYEREWLAMMRRKLGLAQAEHDDKQLVEALLQSFTLVETDYTLFFRALAAFDAQADITAVPATLRAAWYDDQPGSRAEQTLIDWLQRYRARLQAEQSVSAARASLMNAINPLYVLRNWLAQQAIDDAEQGKLDKLRELEQMIQQPYTVQAGKDHLAQKRPEWARQRAGCSMLSCSS
jgi:serine/tyrosine/threonine adenylyltransferase